MSYMLLYYKKTIILAFPLQDENLLVFSFCFLRKETLCDFLVIFIAQRSLIRFVLSYG